MCISVLHSLVLKQFPFGNHHFVSSLLLVFHVFSFIHVFSWFAIFLILVLVSLAFGAWQGSLLLLFFVPFLPTRSDCHLLS